MKEDKNLIKSYVVANEPSQPLVLLQLDLNFIFLKTLPSS